MDEKININFTKKGKDIGEAMIEAFNEWLEKSKLTMNHFLSYKNVKDFHIGIEDKGYYLAYYENGIELQIGCGLLKEQRNTAEWIFSYACVLLEKENNYQGNFIKALKKWGGFDER